MSLTNVSIIMVYSETVLGLGANHLKFPYKMVCKSITLKTEPEIYLSDNSVDEILDLQYEIEPPLIVHLQDDLVLYGESDRTIFEIKNREDWNKVINGIYVSEDNGSVFGTVTCFTGIIVDINASHFPKDLIGQHPTDLRQKIDDAHIWYKKLVDQGRLPSDIQFIMQENCCS